ncbi:hypothetical protein Gotur_025915 [Gossypium turneri]
MLRPVKHSFFKTDSTSPTALRETLVECLPGYNNNNNSDQSSTTSTTINERTLSFSITGMFENFGEEKKSLVYDMLSGKDNSGFGWDEHKHMVVAEDAVKDAQIAADIVEEIDYEDVDTANNLEERNNYHGCQYDVSLDEIDVSAT